MPLPKTNAETVENRRNEILSGMNRLRVNKYASFDDFDLKPYNGDPANIRFYNDGVEVFVREETIAGEGKEFNESRRQHIHLVDFDQKTILEYSLDL